MEGSLIILIITFIISAFLKKKKPPEQAPVKRAQQAKPFTENPFKGLGDFAKEFMEEQQVEIERRKPVLKEEPVAPVLVEKVQRQVSRDQGSPRSQGRLSVFQENTSNLNLAKPVNKSILPDTKEELVRAIIFSEILAPPKSKR